MLDNNLHEMKLFQKSHFFYYKSLTGYQFQYNAWCFETFLWNTYYKNLVSVRIKINNFCTVWLIDRFMDKYN